MKIHGMTSTRAAALNQREKTRLEKYRKAQERKKKDDCDNLLHRNACRIRGRRCCWADN